MAQHASAAKQARKAKQRHLRNKHYDSLLKTVIKRVREAKDKDNVHSALQRAIKLLDRYAAKGLIHRNKAANQKSRLTKFVNAMKQEPISSKPISPQ